MRWPEPPLPLLAFGAPPVRAIRNTLADNPGMPPAIPLTDGDAAPMFGMVPAHAHMPMEPKRNRSETKGLSIHESASSLVFCEFGINQQEHADHEYD
jgi:hypothetical protein